MTATTIEPAQDTTPAQQPAQSDYPEQERAQSEVARVEERQREWGEKRATLVAQLEGRQAGASAAALDGTSTARIAAELGRIRDEIAVADGVLAQLEVNHLAARRGVALGRLADERNRLAALEAEIAERLERNRALATPLYVFELGGPADGTWLPPQSITAGKMAEAERLKHWIADEEGRLERGAQR